MTTDDPADRWYYIKAAFAKAGQFRRRGRPIQPMIKTLLTQTLCQVPSGAKPGRNPDYGNAGASSFSTCGPATSTVIWKWWFVSAER